MDESTLQIDTGDESIPICRFQSNKPGPLLVVVPSIFGISPDVVTFCERFETHGALVYILDPFWRDEVGPLRVPEDSPRALERMRSVDTAVVYRDLLATIDAGLLDPKCDGTVLLLGICFGGRFVMQATHERSVAGVAVWHGAGLLPVLSTSALSECLVSLDYGEDDPLIPPQEVEDVRALLATSGAQIRVHPGAGHGFTHRGTAKCVDEAARKASDAVVSLIQSVVSRSP